MSFSRWVSLSFFVFASVIGVSSSSSAHASAMPAASTSFDGPAELPRVYMKSDLADTPAPGKVKLVRATEDLQAALDAVNCGDTLELEAGGAFHGHFLLPKKPCDDAHWIVIRTSASDSDLPQAGTRITPCYAGLSSLPGRPDFHCTAVKNVMAKIVFAGAGDMGPLFFADGANHYRFIGIEITRESPGVSVVDLAGPKGRVPADHFIFDRVWVHGTAHDETRRGLFLSGMTYVAVVDSFFSDFHCSAETCSDSQTISGAAGDLPMGPFKIVNNLLEASGENILFGGAEATSTPADIEIRRNYLFKPMIWKPGEPGFVGDNNGKPFIVKNHFELKNAQRVLFEGNVLENAWGGFSQSGISVVLTPKNPNNLCPRCLVTDVTVRYCVISHVGGGFSISNVPGAGGSTASAGERYSIHDVVITDVDEKKYDGFGVFMIMISNTPPLKDVKIDHITALSVRTLINMGVKNGKMQNLTFTNNLVGVREKEITSTGGGRENCAFQPERQTPAGVLSNCVNSSTFSHNAIIGGFGAWPPDNFYPKNAEAVGLLYSGDLSAVRLCRTKDSGCKGPSKYAEAATDGKDIGADIELVNKATLNVR